MPPTNGPDLPGVDSVDEQLTARLRAAADALGPAQAARTAHRQPSGEPRYVNRLVLESSPYLLQHAYNPVNWSAWGPEVFQRAKRLDRPIFLSVGYSTCHWCHVMEHESFEDEEIASFLNQHFVAVKVDREERPDVDALYMNAVQMLTGSGGWPMTVVLTPAAEPFFAGTYFPPRDGDRSARVGLLTILRSLDADYTWQREAVVKRAARVSSLLGRLARPQPATDVPGLQAAAAGVAALRRDYDPVWGGFGGAPKFPMPVNLDLLLRAPADGGSPAALDMAVHTLERMAAGGVYDHLGGGFHRYSTDHRWGTPHFEKMLYDQGQLVPVYLDAYQRSGKTALARVATETLDYVAREMVAAGGGFCSATDADSPTAAGELVEGAFFTWTPEELGAVVDEPLAGALAELYGVGAAGDLEGRSVLHAAAPADRVAERLGWSLAELERRRAAGRAALYSARALRPAPLRDDKVLAGWNGLMIGAFARGALVLDRHDYANAAAGAATFVLERLRGSDGRLRRSARGGEARHAGVLEDHAFLVAGLLDLFEATGERRWLDEALGLQAQQDQHFWDDDHGGYFLTPHDGERLLARDRPHQDGALPSGNAVAAHSLLRLAALTDQTGRRGRAERILAAFGAAAQRSPRSAAHMLAALVAYHAAFQQVLVVWPTGQPAPAALLAPLRGAYLPHRAIVLSPDGAPLDALATRIPWLKHKRALGGRPTAYVCEDGQCELPTSDPAVFAAQLTAGIR